MENRNVRTKKCRSLFSQLVFILMAFAVVPFHVALAQIAPSLGTADSFAILGHTTVTNTGPTVVTGDLGLWDGTSVTGFTGLPDGTVIGAMHVTDAVALDAQNANTAAYGILAGQACDTTYNAPTDIGGLTLTPGVYCFDSSAHLTGVLTLNGLGDPAAVWIFKVGSTLTTASSASVVFTDVNEAQNCNVFWQVGSSATIGTGTTFIGNILALASVTITNGASLYGRALAQTGAVTMDNNIVDIGVCAISPTPPTIGKTFSPSTINLGDAWSDHSTLIITLNNPNDTIAFLTAPFTDNFPAGMVRAGSATSTCGGIVTSGHTSVTLTGGSIPANGSCQIRVRVTTRYKGTFHNEIDVGALQTNKGSNVSETEAILRAICTGKLCSK